MDRPVPSTVNVISRAWWPGIVPPAALLPASFLSPSRPTASSTCDRVGDRDVARAVGPRAVLTPTPASKATDFEITGRDSAGSSFPWNFQRESQPPKTVSITPREFAILELLRGGRSTSQVARALGITRSTANFHRREGYTKLGIATRAALMRIPLPAPRDLRKERPRRVAPGARRGDVVACAQCGREFVQWQRPRREGFGRYCSSRCRMLAQPPQARRASRSCLVCGREFQPYNAKVRHCSRACSQVTARASLVERARRAPWGALVGASPT